MESCSFLHGKSIPMVRESFYRYDTLIQALVCPICLYLIVIGGCSGKNSPPDFQLNLSVPQVEGLTVTVNGGVVAPVVRIQWDWGDGSIDNHLYFPATHTYARPGRYTITVTVFDEKNYSASKSISIETQP